MIPIATRDPLRLATVALASCLLSGCATVYYGPNSHNVPLFQKKGEARIAAGWNHEAEIFGSNTSGGEVQGAYAVTDKIGIVANVYVAGASDQETGDEGRGRLFEGGAGYFRPVSRRVVFETYAGAGFGTLTHVRGSDSGKASVNAQRIFVQPSIGFTSDWFDAAGSLRMCALDYSGIPEHPVDARDVAAAQELNANKFSLLAEPSLTLRAGWRYAKLQLQVGLSKNLTHPDLPQVGSYISLGAYIATKHR